MSSAISVYIQHWVMEENRVHRAHRRAAIVTMLEKKLLIVRFFWFVKNSQKMPKSLAQAFLQELGFQLGISAATREYLSHLYA